MSRFDRKKIAVTLAFASLFGNKTSSMNSNINTKSANKAGFSTEKNLKSGAEIPKPLGTLNIRNDSSGNKIFNWVKNHKAVSIAVPSVVVATAVGFTIWGVKHKNKDNQNPGGQKPGDQRPSDQNKGKGSGEVPPKTVDNNSKENKENLPPNNLSNNPNPAPPPQQNIGINNLHGAAAYNVGQQNAQSFVNAVNEFNNDNPGKVLEIKFLSKILAILSTVFPASLKNMQNFALLANLKQQNNVIFAFKNINGIYGDVIHCHVFIGNLVYDFYTYGGADSFNAFIECRKCVKQGENVQWPLVEKIKIENGVVQKLK